MASSVPWVEKYRPRTVDEVSHQDEVVKALKTALETANLPHLLFYGPPGTGKTSTILAIAKQLFGPEQYRKRILELNASDDRGIAVVREKIKTFAQAAVGGNKETTTSGYPCPPFKIIILDEADSMTADAQSALRRVMENYTKVTRFCLICNYASRIIDPITSRCAKFRFQPIATGTHLSRLQHIATAENLQCQPEVFNTLVQVTEGDLRKSITFLQSASRLYGARITPGHIIDMAGLVPPAELQDLFAAIRSNHFDNVQRACTDVMGNGYPASQFLLQLFDVVVSSDLADTKKARMAELMAETDKRLIDGADEFLQLLNVAAQCMRLAASP